MAHGYRKRSAQSIGFPFVGFAISLLISGASPEAQSGTEDLLWAVQFNAKLDRADQ